MLLFGSNKEKGLQFEDRFGFIGDDKSVRLEGRKKIELEELSKKNVVIFVSKKLLDLYYKSRPDKENFEFYLGGKMLYKRDTKTMYKSFDDLANESNLEIIKKNFKIAATSKAEIMEAYIEKIRATFKLQRRQIAIYNYSGIAECITYKGISRETIYQYSNNLPKTQTERIDVYNYYNRRIMEQRGAKYGVLDCKPGIYQNVLRIDLNNFYGWLLCTQKYLEGNPYQVLNEKTEEKYDFINFEIRQRVLNNYKGKVKAKENKDRGIELLYKAANNMIVGRSENLGIYLNRKRTSAKCLLGPQHGFETILKGIEKMNAYTKVFESIGDVSIKRDTDGISLVVKDIERTRIAVKKINEIVVQCLIKAGFSEEDAKCGLGQFEEESFCKNYCQLKNKCYIYEDEKGLHITHSGMTEEVKEQLILNSNGDFKKLVNLVKNHEPEISIKAKEAYDYGF